MTALSTDVLICGAGIAGISTAFHLLKRDPKRSILLIDQGEPLSLTSDKSTECYRNFWPGPEASMVRMMNRSIDILEEVALESDNVMNMNRRGYIFSTTRPEQAEKYRLAALIAQDLGAGPLRVHDRARNGLEYQPSPPEGFRGSPDGSDLIVDRALIRKHYPEISESVQALLHIRRAGWLSAQQLGMFLLQVAQRAGLTFQQDRVEGVCSEGGRVKSVDLAGLGMVQTGVFVNAAGPFVQSVSELMGVELPVLHELHLKVSFHDQRGVVPRKAPLLIWGDPQRLDWSETEAADLADSPENGWLLEEFPAGVHIRPEGGSDSDIVLLLWEYDAREYPPNFPIPIAPEYPEIAMRGICRMLPGIETYLTHLPKPVVDGGYYTKTRENRPLACQLPLEGAYLIGALSGFGVMASQALGELLAALIDGGPVPDYATAFDLRRYDDPAYMELLENWGESWQI